MKRTEWLQETRKMRFEEAYKGWRNGRLTQAEAAMLLGVCDRTFRRYMSKYDEGGLDALMDKRLSQASHRCAPVDEVMRLTEQNSTAAVIQAGMPGTFIRGIAKMVAHAAIHGLRTGCRKRG